MIYLGLSTGTGVYIGFIFWDLEPTKFIRNVALNSEQLCCTPRLYIHVRCTLLLVKWFAWCCTNPSIPPHFRSSPVRLSHLFLYIFASSFRCARKLTVPLQERNLHGAFINVVTAKHRVHTRSNWALGQGKREKKQHGLIRYLSAKIKSQPLI